MFKVKTASISGKLPRSLSSMYGKTEPTVKNSLNTEDLLKTLYVNVGSTLNTLLQNYSQGNIDAVIMELDEGKYDKLSTNFRNNSKPEFLYYEIVRILFSKTLDGLNQSIRQYITLIDTMAKLENCNKYKNILDDPEKLNEYIEQLKARRYLFEVEPITVMKTLLKPKYSEYIRLYGFPDGGIFESEKIGDIIYKLENNLPVTPINTITL